MNSATLKLPWPAWICVILLPWAVTMISSGVASASGALYQEKESVTPTVLIYQSSYFPTTMTPNDLHEQRRADLEQEFTAELGRVFRGLTGYGFARVESMSIITMDGQNILTIKWTIGIDSGHPAFYQLTTQQIADKMETELKAVMAQYGSIRIDTAPRQKTDAEDDNLGIWVGVGVGVACVVVLFAVVVLVVVVIRRRRQPGLVPHRELKEDDCSSSAGSDASTQAGVRNYTYSMDIVKGQLPDTLSVTTESSDAGSLQK